MRVKGRHLLALLVLGVTIALVVRQFGVVSGAGDAGGTPGAPRIQRVVPESLRIKVEVLNASGITGQARRATAVLRSMGFDVVASGNADTRVDSTTVLVRSGRDDWGALAAEGLQARRVTSRPDNSRYLDLTILLGPDWRPPPQAFYP
jgi:hypothetical protein